MKSKYLACVLGLSIITSSAIAASILPINPGIMPIKSVSCLSPDVVKNVKITRFSPSKNPNPVWAGMGSLKDSSGNQWVVVVMAYATKQQAKVEAPGVPSKVVQGMMIQADDGSEGCVYTSTPNFYPVMSLQNALKNPFVLVIPPMMDMSSKFLR